MLLSLVKLAPLLIPLCMLAFACATQGETEPTFPGKKAVWHGYARHDFRIAERACLVVIPRKAIQGRPWIWRARFFGHEPQADLALLERGFHLVYIDVAGLYGDPKAVAIWDAFYEYLTSKHGLTRRAVLEGFSRGGLIVYNWAASNPDKVACIYGDAPVCDIRSWPGGKGKGNGSPGDWAACLRVYGLSEQTAADFKGSPIDKLEPIATAGIPILHVCGDADTSVPLEENTRVLEQRYKALGGQITTIVKKGCAHHPHSLEDPTPIVEFVLKHTLKPQS